MSYHVLDPNRAKCMDDRPCETRELSGEVDLENLGARFYRVTPGEQMPLAYHYHDEQEELFYVIDGSLHVETPEEVFTVPTGQLFVAEPGNPHRAFNPDDADGAVEVLAFGAPAVDDAQPYDP